MAANLPPIPNNPITDTFVWRDWFFKVSQLLVQQASIAWSSIDFTGSNLLDIKTRQHNALQAIQGGNAGQYYHLTAAEHAAVAALPSVPFSTSVGGTGTAGTLTGYVYGHGTSPMTASTTIPMADVVTGYGSFQNNADQTFSTANTATQLVVNTTDFIKGMTRSGSTITDITPGIYNLQYSLQMVNTSTSIHEIEVWLRKNGSDLAGTATKFSITSSHGGTDGYSAPTCNFFLQLAVTDTVELWCSVSNTALYIEAYTAQTTPFARPSIPSTVFTLSQVA
jgi:hypothetical protein